MLYNAPAVLSMKDTALLLNQSSAKALYKLLRDNAIFHPDNTPGYQYKAQGYFVVEHVSYRHPKTRKRMPYKRTLVTNPKGIELIIRLIKQEKTANGPQAKTRKRISPRTNKAPQKAV